MKANHHFRVNSLFKGSEIIVEEVADVVTYPRHKLTFKSMLHQQDCFALSVDEIDQLARMEKDLSDFCRCCIFLTIFSEDGISVEHRRLFWRHLLKVNL